MKRKVTDEESQKLRSYDLDWIEFRTESTRLYPKEESAAHVIGSVNHEEHGNNGVELSLDKAASRQAGCDANAGRCPSERIRPEVLHRSRSQART